MKDYFLLISNLAHHPDELFYTGGIPWDEFRNTAEKNLKKLARFQKNEVEWTVVQSDTLSADEWGKLANEKYTGIIVSGSPYNISDDQPWITSLFSFLTKLLDTQNHPPLLGVCFGHQVLAKIHGGDTEKHSQYWKGNVAVVTQKNDQYVSYANHGEYVCGLPDSVDILATGPEGMPYIVKYTENVYGIQCHLERDVECPMSQKFWKEFLEDLFLQKKSKEDVYSY